MKKIYISGLGKEEIPHIEFWMLSYHILVREFFRGNKIKCTQLCTLHCQAMSLYILLDYSSVH